MLMFQAGYVLSWSISDNQIIPARASSHIHLSDRLIISVINHHGRNEDLAAGNLPHDGNTNSQTESFSQYNQSMTLAIWILPRGREGERDNGPDKVILALNKRLPSSHCELQQRRLLCGKMEVFRHNIPAIPFHCTELSTLSWETHDTAFLSTQ